MFTVIHLKATIPTHVYLHNMQTDIQIFCFQNIHTFIQLNTHKTHAYI